MDITKRLRSASEADIAWLNAVKPRLRNAGFTEQECDRLRQLATQTMFEYAATNGSMLALRCRNGDELQIQWVDDNGNPIKGKPVLRRAGLNIITRQVKEIEHRSEVGL